MFPKVRCYLTSLLMICFYFQETQLRNFADDNTAYGFGIGYSLGNLQRTLGLNSLWRKYAHAQVFDLKTHNC